jgi:hypothetical protein
MVGVSLVTTARCVLRLRIEETASRYGGSTEDKIDDMKDSFFEELECVFRKFPKYHMKILLGDFTAKVGRENIFNRRVVFSVGSS